MDWIYNKPDKPTKIIEIPNATDDPIPIYKRRYVECSPTLLDLIQKQIGVYNKEIFGYFHKDCSVLNVGAGHGSYTNEIRLSSLNIGLLEALDYVEESRCFLYPDTPFHHVDIIQDDLPSTYDYIISMHTIEHFTRDQIIENVMPKLINHAKKAVVIIVPYKEAWKDEPSHKCFFSEDDELSACAKMYKILNNEELVLWFEGGYNA